MVNKHEHIVGLRRSLALELELLTELMQRDVARVVEHGRDGCLFGLGGESRGQDLLVELAVDLPAVGLAGDALGGDDDRVQEADVRDELDLPFAM